MALQNGENYLENYLVYYKYLIEESEEYLSIVECSNSASISSSSSETIKNVYTINKKDGTLVTESELLTKYNLTEDIVLDFVAKKYNEFNENETSFTKEDFKKGNLDKNTYYYVSNNKLHILMNNSDFSADKIIYDFEY